MNLPNAITLARITLVPLLVVVLLTKFEGRQILGVRHELVGAAIFAIASLTDWLDGYLARRRKQITTFGQLMDPLADKLLITAAFVSLVQMGLAPAWMVAVIVGREFLVTVLRSIAHARGVVIPASPLGKVKMVAEVTAILTRMYDEARRVLSDHRDALDRVSEALLERETLEGSDLLLLIKGLPLPAMRTPVAAKPGPPPGRVKAEPSKAFPGEKLPDPEPVPG